MPKYVKNIFGRWVRREPLGESLELAFLNKSELLKKSGEISSEDHEKLVKAVESGYLGKYFDKLKDYATNLKLF